MSAAPTVGLSSPGATRSASLSPSAASSPPPVGAAPVPGAWSSISVVALSQPRPSNGTVVEWKGGDLAIAPETSDGPERLFSSTDGRSWAELPASTLGFDDPSVTTLLNGATACGDGVLVETVDGGGHVWLWWSTDLRDWTKTPFHNEGYATLAAIGSTAVANVDTGGGDPTGTAMDVSTDCRTWRRVGLPGPKVAQITDLVANPAGFAAVGSSADVGDPSGRPLAWWSSDGLHWSAGSAPSTRNERFVTVDAGSDGFLAAESSNDADALQGGPLFSSTDGHAWKGFSGDPLGTITSGEGVGSPAGTITSDGLHLLFYGRKGISPADDSAGTAQYWLSTDGVHWSRPAIGGQDATALLADQYPVPMLLPSGILFAGQDTSWLGTP